jgi:hypothetical protein
VLTRPPGTGAGTETIKIVFCIDTYSSSVPVAAIYPRNQDIILSAAKLIYILHITLAPVENGAANPIIQVIEG